MSRASAVAFLLTAACAASTPRATVAVQMQAPRADRLYVTNQDDATVSIVSLTTHEVLETLDLQQMGFAANAKPHHAMVAPDGKIWYLTLIGGGKVLKLDRDNHIVGSVDMPVPGLMSLHPTEDLLVVAHSMAAVNPPRLLTVIRPSDMTRVDEIGVFFPRPHALILHPTGSHAYVASLGVNQLASVRLDDGALNLVDVEGPLHTLTQFAISPDGHWLVATAELSNQLLVFDLTDPDRPIFSRSIAMEDGPFEPGFALDGKTVFVTNLRANAVTVVGTDDWTVRRVIRDERFAQPHGVGFGPDGRYVYISNRSQSGGAHDHEGGKPVTHGYVAAICIPTLTVEAMIPVGNYAAGIGVPAPVTVPKTPSTCR
jgi:DNA-binding beta-propeller fold protein YncE